MDYDDAPAEPTAERTQTPALLGKRVVVMDLKSRADLNGSAGDVLSYDQGAGRYVVQMNDERLSLKAANLRLHTTAASGGVHGMAVNEGSRIQSHTKVTMEGLAGRADLNGQIANVLHYEEDKERYALCVDGSLEMLLLRGINLKPVKAEKQKEWRPDTFTAHAQYEIDDMRAEQDREMFDKQKKNPFGFTPS